MPCSPGACARSSAPEAGLIALLEPVLNPIWVVLVTGERPAPATLVGGLFLLAGVALPLRTEDSTDHKDTMSTKEK